MATNDATGLTPFNTDSALFWRAMSRVSVSGLPLMDSSECNTASAWLSSVTPRRFTRVMVCPTVPRSWVS